MKLKHEYHKPDITDWNLVALEKVIDGLRDSLDRAVSEAIALIFENEETSLEWPAEWGETDGYYKKSPVDPLLVYLTLGMGSFSENPVYSFNLGEALRDSIEQCRRDGSYSDGLARIKDALRRLADDIESALMVKHEIL